MQFSFQEKDYFSNFMRMGFWVQLFLDGKNVGNIVGYGNDKMDHYLVFCCIFFWRYHEKNVWVSQ